jgi:hypothetical protein
MPLCLCGSPPLRLASCQSRDTPRESMIATLLRLPLGQGNHYACRGGDKQGVWGARQHRRPGRSGPGSTPRRDSVKSSLARWLAAGAGGACSAPATPLRPWRQTGGGQQARVLKQGVAASCPCFSSIVALVVTLSSTVQASPGPSPGRRPTNRHEARRAPRSLRSRVHARPRKCLPSLFGLPSHWRSRWCWLSYASSYRYGPVVVAKRQRVVVVITGASAPREVAVWTRPLTGAGPVTSSRSSPRHHFVLQGLFVASTSKSIVALLLARLPACPLGRLPARLQVARQLRGHTRSLVAVNRASKCSAGVIVGSTWAITLATMKVVA